MIEYAFTAILLTYRVGMIFSKRCSKLVESPESINVDATAGGGDDSSSPLL